jgi:hypothetical protein
MGAIVNGIIYGLGFSSVGHALQGIFAVCYPLQLRRVIFYIVLYRVHYERC